MSHIISIKGSPLLTVAITAMLLASSTVHAGIWSGSITPIINQSSAGTTWSQIIPVVMDKHEGGAAVAGGAEQALQPEAFTVNGAPPTGQVSVSEGGSSIVPTMSDEMKVAAPESKTSTYTNVPGGSELSSGSGASIAAVEEKPSTSSSIVSTGSGSTVGGQGESSSLGVVASGIQTQTPAGEIGVNKGSLESTGNGAGTEMTVDTDKVGEVASVIPAGGGGAAVTIPAKQPAAEAQTEEIKKGEIQKVPIPIPETKKEPVVAQLPEEKKEEFVNIPEKEPLPVEKPLVQTQKEPAKVEEPIKIPVPEVLKPTGYPEVQKEPAAKEPLPVAKEPLPAAKEPLPVAKAPLPVAKEPIPTAKEPVAEEPAAGAQIPEVEEGEEPGSANQPIQDNDQDKDKKGNEGGGNSDLDGVNRISQLPEGLDSSLSRSNIFDLSKTSSIDLGPVNIVDTTVKNGGRVWVGLIDNDDDNSEVIEIDISAIGSEEGVAPEISDIGITDAKKIGAFRWGPPALDALVVSNGSEVFIVNGHAPLLVESGEIVDFAVADLDGDKIDDVVVLKRLLGGVPETYELVVNYMKLDAGEPTPVREVIIAELHIPRGHEVVLDAFDSDDGAGEIVLFKGSGSGGVSRKCWMGGAGWHCGDPLMDARYPFAHRRDRVSRVVDGRVASSEIDTEVYEDGISGRGIPSEEWRAVNWNRRTTTSGILEPMDDVLEANVQTFNNERAAVVLRCDGRDGCRTLPGELLNGCATAPGNVDIMPGFSDRVYIGDGGGSDLAILYARSDSSGDDIRLALCVYNNINEFPVVFAEVDAEKKATVDFKAFDPADDNISTEFSCESDGQDCTELLVINKVQDAKEGLEINEVTVNVEEDPSVPAATPKEVMPADQKIYKVKAITTDMGGKKSEVVADVKVDGSVSLIMGPENLLPGNRGTPADTILRDPILLPVQHDSFAIGGGCSLAGIDAKGNTWLILPILVFISSLWWITRWWLLNRRA